MSSSRLVDREDGALDAKEERIKQQMSGELLAWLSQHKLEALSYVSDLADGVGLKAGAHLRVRKEGAPMPAAPRASNSKSSAKATSTLAPVAQHDVPAAAAKTKGRGMLHTRPGQRTKLHSSVKGKAKGRARGGGETKDVGHPSLEQEMCEAEAQAAALAKRLGELAGETEDAIPDDGLDTKLTHHQYFTNRAAKVRVEIDGARALIAKEWDSLAIRVGLAITKNKLKPRDLVAQWDKKGKGVLSKVEWRQGLQDGLGIKADRKAVDALFDSFDDDGGGTLDAPELRDALERTMDNVKSLRQREKQLGEAQVPLQKRMTELEALAESTREARVALLSGADGAAELEATALAKQEEFAAVEEEQRRREEAEQEALEAARREERRLEAEEKARVAAEVAAKVEAERKRAELEAAQLESSQSLLERISQVKVIIESIEPGALKAALTGNNGRKSAASDNHLTVEQKVGQELVKKNGV